MNIKGDLGGEHWSYHTTPGLGHSRTWACRKWECPCGPKLSGQGAVYCPHGKYQKTWWHFWDTTRVCKQSNTHTARTENLDVLGAVPDLRRNSTRTCSWEEGRNRKGHSCGTDLWVWNAGVDTWLHLHGGLQKATPSWCLEVSCWEGLNTCEGLTPVMEPECSRTTRFSVLYNSKCRGIWEMRL